MAALKVKEDATGRLVLQSPLLPSWGNLFSMLVWIGILAFFFLPAFAGNGIDWENLAFILFFFVVTVGASLVTSLILTTVTLDRSSRVLTVAKRFIGIPIGVTAVPFGDLTNVEYQYYRQSSGRYSHDAWRVNVISKDGKRIPLSWDGKQEEMAGVAQKVSNLTGVELMDNSAKPVSTARQILDTAPPWLKNLADTQGTGNAPTALPTDTALPDMTETLPAPDAPLPGDVQWAPQSTQWSNPADTAPEVEPPLESAVPSIPASMETQPSEPTTALRNLSIAQLEQRAAGDPMDADARFVLARKYQERAALDRAIDMYQQVMRLDPTNANAQNDLGVALLLRGKRTEAEAALRRAVALDPFSSITHLNLGLLLRSAKRAADASQEFYLARQNARGNAETRAAETASTGGKIDPLLSRM